MSITSLSNSLTGTLANQTSSASKKTTTSTTTSSTATPSIGKQLLAAVAQAQGNPLVSLGQSDNSTLTYDAKGLLRQLQNNTLSNPMWQDNSDDNSNSNAQAQSLFAAMHLPSATTTGTGTTSAADAKAQALAVINGTADSNGNNTNWAQMLKQNPALAGVMLDQQNSKSMISMLA